VKVLHFYKTSKPDSIGGVEQLIDQIASGTAKLGIDTEVLSLTKERNAKVLEMNGYCVHRSHLDFKVASTYFSMSVFSRFSELAKKADIIHYHFPWPFMDLVHFITHVKKPTIVTYHSDIIRQKKLLKLYKPLKNQFLSSVDHIVATSQNYLDTSHVLKKFSEKVSIIPIGLDKKSYAIPTLERLDYWKDRFSGRFFLFVGVLRYYKGLHILVEASQGTDYPIVIVGAGPVEVELKAKVAQLGLHNIHFLGFLSDEDKVALLTLCFGVVFPSHMRSEAFGISLLEGAMFGKPMISSEIGTGTSFINIADVTGLVIPPSDPIALRQAMRFLWDHPDKAAEMGSKAEARYWRHFTAVDMVSAYAKIYYDLAQK